MHSQASRQDPGQRVPTAAATEHIVVQDLAESARGARATSAKLGSGRCSACRARGVTLWQVAGCLVCATCRAANEMTGAPQSGRRQAPGRGKAARQVGTVTTATTGKDITWAAGQDANDRKAGVECRCTRISSGSTTCPGPSSLSGCGTHTWPPGSRRPEVTCDRGTSVILWSGRTRHGSRRRPRRREETSNGLNTKGARTGSLGNPARGTRRSSSPTGYTDPMPPFVCGTLTISKRSRHALARHHRSPDRSRAGLAALP